MTSPSFFAVLARVAVPTVLASACADADAVLPPSAPPDAPPPAAVSPERAADRAPLPVGPGLYHLRGGPYAANVELRPDGTFATEYRGCTDTFTRCGAWKHDAGGAVVLTADAKSRALYWTDPLGANRAVSEVVMVASSDGVTIDARVSAVDGQDYREVWAAGGACPVCGAGQKRGSRIACDAPITQECP